MIVDTCCCRPYTIGRILDHLLAAVAKQANTCKQLTTRWNGNTQQREGVNGRRDKTGVRPCTTISQHMKALHNATESRYLTRRECQRQAKLVYRFTVATTTSQHMYASNQSQDGVVILNEERASTASLHHLLAAVANINASEY